MFFTLAKIVWFFVQPLNLAIFLLLGAMVAGFFGWRRLFGAGVFAAFAVLALTIWTSLGTILLQPLEQSFVRPTELSRVDGIVVLGGGMEGKINMVRGGYELNSGGDRLVEAAVLALRYPQAKVVVSGGSGALMLSGEGDGDTAPRLLMALGVARERLILENKSRDTYENALFTKQLVRREPGETWLLVTSAFHMPRSMALFAKAGFAVLPWPTDYRTTGQESFRLFGDNAGDALDNTTGAMREWIGLLAYWLSGRIDSPLPAPG